MDYVSLYLLITILCYLCFYSSDIWREEC